MATKPQDVLVALKLTLGGGPPKYAELGQALGISASEAHAAVRRLLQAGLIDPETKRVRTEALREFLEHGVPYAFPASPQEMTRGMPTAWAAPVMAQEFNSSDQVQPVWADPQGSVQGASVRPLYASVPGAARRDPKLYELLALVDALRIGRARERAMAAEKISRRLSPDPTA
jgi:DNA-binding Lrp family transcriptional regulator